MQSIKELQAKVNKISEELNGIDTLEKLQQAKAIARQDGEVKNLLLEILDKALTRKWNADTKATVEAFLNGGII